MARETKVGLLAGLAFIICFAVILANRGRQVPPPQEPQSTRFQFAQGQQTQTQSPRARRRDAQAPNRNGNNRSNYRPSKPHRNTSDLRRPAPRDDDPVDTRYDERMAAAQARAAQDAADTRFRELEQRLNALSREVKSGSRDDIPLSAAAPTDDAKSAHRAATEVPTHSPDVSQAAKAMPGQPAAQPPQRIHERRPQPPQAVVRYEVVKGDTLSRIASIHYHARSKRFIDAIMDANRGVLSDPNLLKVGMKLAIPAIDGVQHASPDAARPSEEVRERSQRPPNRQPKRAPFRWYQIQKNDRYVGIARRELGDEDRWREIYEMNKSIFPDPSQIRTGVRIKLPVVAVADNREGRSP